MTHIHTLDRTSLDLE